jgi:hypothetical protein
VRPALAATLAIALAVALLSPRWALAQGAGQFDPPDTNMVPGDADYPDAVICGFASPDAVTYRVIFYKSQTISFAGDRANAAEYGTPFLRDPDKFDPSVVNKWRLQLGRPGNITAITLPDGWTNVNCQVGKSIDKLKAGKQLMRFLIAD